MEQKEKTDPFGPQFATRLVREALSLVVLLPSLIAEMTPLVLYWNAHIPVWQMSLMMFGAWAVVWWGTRIIAMAVWKAVP